jgi:glutamine cyclotransferase/predicted secreted protein
MKALLITVTCCIALLTASLSCNRTAKHTTANRAGQQIQPAPVQRKALITITSPTENAVFPLGATVPLSITPKDAATTIDSVRWFINGRWLETATTNAVTWNTAGYTTGMHRIEAVAYYSFGQRDIIPVTVLLLAANPPKQYTYKVIRTYPHDPDAYTQGLLIDHGSLYESTGQYGKSSLRKVDLTTGKPLLSTPLPADMFGEGLALVDNRLIQLTWQNQLALTYQKNDFKPLQRIAYPIKEGWGLVFDGTHLLMTDGSANLYFLDKDCLAEVKRLQVCDHKGLIMQLNELEYINGELWANLYTSNIIVRINPLTGEVTGHIDMTGLLPAADRTPTVDVLNGIAYDDATGKVYLTGKNWPKLFEVQIIPARQ